MDYFNFIRFNTIYFALSLAVIGVSFPDNVSLGIKQFFLVVVYHLLFVIYSYVLRLKNWLDLFQFLVMLSIFMLIPDWIFSLLIKVLIYIDQDIPEIGGIPVYIAGIWTIPLFLIVQGAEINYQTYKKKWGRTLILLLGSFLAFNFFEEITWELPVWYYKNVLMVSHVAAYIILPNTLIGVFTYYAYQYVKFKPFLWKVLAAFLVMLAHLGVVMASYFISQMVFSMFYIKPIVSILSKLPIS